MKLRLFALLLMTAVLAAGCGKNSESTKTASSDIEEVVDIDEDEIVDIDEEVVTSEGSDESYPEDDPAMEDSFVIDADTAPTTSDIPASGSYGDFVTLGNYEGLEIRTAEGTPIEINMTVTMDYEGRINGTAFEGGSGQNYDYFVGGSDQFGPSFDEELVGHRAGDRFSAKVEYPADYYDEVLAGQTVDYDISVLEVYLTTPDIALMNVTEESTVLKYPESMLRAWKDAYLEQFRSNAFEESETDEELLAENGFDTAEDFDSFIRSFVKSDLVCLALMDKAGLTKDSEEFESAKLAALSKNGVASVSEALSYGYTELEMDQMAEEYLAQGVLVSLAAADAGEARG